MLAWQKLITFIEGVGSKIVGWTAPATNAKQVRALIRYSDSWSERLSGLVYISCSGTVLDSYSSAVLLNGQGKMLCLLILCAQFTPLCFGDVWASCSEEKYCMQQCFLLAQCSTRQSTALDCVAGNWTLWNVCLTSKFFFFHKKANSKICRGQHSLLWRGQSVRNVFFFFF